MTDEVTLVDEYGKRTRFRGIRLVEESTDTDRGEKPQWAEIEVWRTEAGAYVVQRTTHYRIRHLTEDCQRLGANLLPRSPTESDTYPCPRCNTRNLIEPGKGYGVTQRSSVDIARTPADLIRLLANSDGTYSGLIRAVLAEISEQDQAIATLWMEEVIP